MVLKNRFWIIVFVAVLLGCIISYAEPTGPSVIFISNETATPESAAKINTSGGQITTMLLNATSQNLRWKGYVGNVSGKLTLDDASGSSLYDWTLASVGGEVYATRNSTLINWANVNCSNSTNLADEDQNLDHTSPDDNVSATFSTKDHDAFFVGTFEIVEDSCYSIHTYVNDTPQSTDFEEVSLFDGTSMIFSTPLEQDLYGFDNNTYDFQMIVPERGTDGWQSSTAYYFYVELS